MKYIYFLFIIFVTLGYGRELKIMPVGDSITFGYSFNPPPDELKHSYRNYLWYYLEDTKIPVDFVGSRKSGWAVKPKFDTNNEGYTGYTSFNIADIIYKKLVKYKPDIILLHIGTNDMWIEGNKDNPTISGVDKILDKIDKFEKKYNYHVKVIVAQIIDMTYHPKFVNIFNSKLKTLVNKRILDGDDLVLIDMQHDAHLEYNSKDFQDPLHPNNSGYKKMAKLWFSTLKKYMFDYFTVPSADFNGDGVADILWRKGNVNHIWYMSADGSQ